MPSNSFNDLVRKHREARLRVESLFGECGAIGEWLSQVGVQLNERPWEVEESELIRLAAIADVVIEYKEALAEFARLDKKYRQAWIERGAAGSRRRAGAKTPAARS